jgi:hypothetical protein
MEHYELFAHVNNSIRTLALDGERTQIWEFICECRDVGCHQQVSLTLVEFDEHRAASPPLPILAAGHGARRAQAR